MNIILIKLIESVRSIGFSYIEFLFHGFCHYTIRVIERGSVEGQPIYS